MNNNYSYTRYQKPENYVPRWITPLLQQALEDMPVLVLTGARQVGKSTLLLNEQPFRNFRFLSLDDFDVLRQAQEQPEALWAGSDRVILDEVQKAPHLLPAVKRAVDQSPRRIKFVLSGSANLLLMKRVSESLAGRAVYCVLDPLTLGEINQSPPPDLIRNILSGNWPKEGHLDKPLPDALPGIQRGLMPALLRLNTAPSWVRWWDGYVATYLERDLRQVAQIDALVDFRRLMELLALRSGQMLNQSDLARDAGLSQPTAHRYINLLETTHLFKRVPSYASNRTTRMLKAPKAYWNDTGLAVFLAGYFQEEELRKARELGNFFESFIYHHLHVLAQLMTPPARLYHWRTQTGQEVDFVLEFGRKVVAIEVKRTGRPGYGDANGLNAFLSHHPDAAGGLLLHGGTEIRRLGERILAAPWTMVTG
ncbi:MAG: ATP-binding protein [Anaerolineae bacterium]|nr:ATP-binding protein [Anaerolineae bacterium]